jgi:hypothetical protein
MAILNYTTKIPVEKTIAEIESILAQSGAEKILKDYDNQSNVEAISFVIRTEKGKLSFRLPMNQEAVLQTLKNQSGEYKTVGCSKVRKVPGTMVTKEQAGRVGWRIIKDWLEAQLALFFLQMVKIEEIFLPYMYNERTKQTMFQMLEKKGFNFQLEDKTPSKIYSTPQESSLRED